MATQKQADAKSLQSFNPFVSNIKKEFSYLNFSNQIRITSEMAVSVQSFLGISDASGITSLSKEAEIEGTPEGVIFRRGGSNIPNTVIEHGTGLHFLILQGTASRVSFPVDIPYVESVGFGSTQQPTTSGNTKLDAQNSSGQNNDLLYPVLYKDRLLPNQIGSYTADGKPIYIAAWERIYVLPSLGNREVKLKNVDIRFLTSKKDYEQINVKTSVPSNQLIQT